MACEGCTGLQEQCGCRGKHAARQHCTAQRRGQTLHAAAAAATAADCHCCCCCCRRRRCRRSPRRQYAGTGALKSGFTRTGKRTLGGLIDDGVKSITRYYLNNFKVGCIGFCIALFGVVGLLKPKCRVQQHSVLEQGSRFTWWLDGVEGLGFGVGGQQGDPGHASTHHACLSGGSTPSPHATNTACCPLLCHHACGCAGMVSCVLQDGHKQDALDLISGAFKVGLLAAAAAPGRSSKISRLQYRALFGG